MIKRTYLVKSPEGIHARPASLLTSIAMKYNGPTDIEYKGEILTLKSIMVLMSLGVGYKEEFNIIANCENENQFIEEVETLMIDQELI